MPQSRITSETFWLTLCVPQQSQEVQQCVLPPSPGVASKDAWYVEFNGRQVRLAKGRDNEKAAREAFYKLMANGSGKLPEADTLRVAAVCDLFLDHSQKHHVPDTYHWYRDYLQDFCDLYETLLVQDLKPLHASKWLEAHPAGSGARRK